MQLISKNLCLRLFRVPHSLCYEQCLSRKLSSSGNVRHMQQQNERFSMHFKPFYSTQAGHGVRTNTIENKNRSEVKKESEVAPKENVNSFF